MHFVFSDGLAYGGGIVGHGGFNVDGRLSHAEARNALGSRPLRMSEPDAVNSSSTAVGVDRGSARGFG
jgi:hypothetical protein